MIDSNEGNRRHVIVLSHLSKVYEKYIFNQISKYHGNIRFKHQYRFKGGVNLQYCLVVLIGKYKT